MKSHDFSYCFLRYRQGPEAGEFANIGVALWSPENRFLGFEGSKRFSRLTHFFGDLDRDGYRLLVAHVERRFDALAEKLTQDSLWPAQPADIKEIAFQVVPQDDGALVWSPARGGMAEDPNAELSRIFHRYIGAHNEAPEKSRRDDGEVFRSVYRKAFAPEALASRIQEHEIVAPLASHTFKHAWKNGIWNVYETLSFDLLDADSIEKKAHTWFGRSVHLAQSQDRPKINFLLGKPELASNAKAYGKAKDILSSEHQVTLVEEDEAVNFAESLQAQVLAA
ncbi:MAG: DUF3037 domain-containing protein [Terrimicrobiaceae bacterium]